MTRLRSHIDIVPEESHNNHLLVEAPFRFIAAGVLLDERLAFYFRANFGIPDSMRGYSTLSATFLCEHEGCNVEGVVPLPELTMHLDTTRLISP